MPLYKPPLGVSAGTLSSNRSDVTFSNGSGVSFGLNTNGVITGAVASTYGGTGFTTTSSAGAVVAGTLNTSGLKLGVPAYLTTAALSQDSSKYAGLNSAITGGSLTVNTSGISINLPAYLTTAMASGRGTDFVQAAAAFAGTNASGTIASNGISVSVAAPGAGNALTVQDSATTLAATKIIFSNANNVAFGLSTAASLATVTASVAIASPTYSFYFEPFDFKDGTATSTGSLSQLGVQGFTLPMNMSFGNVNMIGQATVVPTSASHNWSVRITNSTFGLVYSAQYGVTNSNFVDLFLFSRGTGVFSSELETFASTRNSFVTYYLATVSNSATLTNAAGGSLKASQTLSVSISYPFMTSATSTSINAASSYTAWGSGYTTWTSTASNSTVDTISTSAAKALALASTYPATVGWSGAKMVYHNFGTSLTPGEYWLGMVRYSSVSSSSVSGQTTTGALGTGNSYSITYNASNLTQTAQNTYAGKTLTVVNSLGSLGFVTTDNVGPDMGLGVFSNTWMASATYLNNLANPNGAVAFTQIKTSGSFFESWFQLASNRI